MQTTNEFTVPLAPKDAWPILVDLERVAGCLPGATITAVDGDDYEGRAKIKVGPVTVEYKGVARFESCDDANHHAVIRATGKDARGQGGVAATITARLLPDVDGSRVVVSTELDLTGKVAQFGRGVIADTTATLFRTFAQRLADQMTASTAPPVATDSEGAGVTGLNASAEPRGDEKPLDLLGLARQARAERSGPPTTQTPVIVAFVAAIAAAVSALVSVRAAGRARGPHGLVSDRVQHAAARQ